MNNISPDKLAAQILALIPKYPQIANFTSAWELLFLEEFKDAPMTASLDQADWALAKARSDYALQKQKQEIENEKS
jgi:hypothetical protein